jgi:hypothetical protein
MSREAQKLYRREFEAKEEEYLALQGYTLFCTSVRVRVCAACAACAKYNARDVVTL